MRGGAKLWKTITAYPRAVNPDTGEFIPVRCVLRRCTWMDESVTTTLETGNVVSNITVIRVFDDPQGKRYIPPHEWNRLPITPGMEAFAPYWTVDLTQPLRLIVPWESEYIFPSWGTAATPENRFMNDNPGVRNIQDFNDNRFDDVEGASSVRGRHILLRC